MRNLIDWTRVNNDVNGNPRYVCHFLNILSDLEHERINKQYSTIAISEMYMFALNIAKTFGGKKFHNKQYGGGIIFQCYNLDDLSRQILERSGKVVEYYRQPTAYEIKQGYGAIHYKSFERSKVTNRKGELKKWFKDSGEGQVLTYSRSSN